MQEVSEEEEKRIRNIFHRCMIRNGRLRTGQGGAIGRLVLLVGDL
jgi:hypothetical protein